MEIRGNEKGMKPRNPEGHALSWPNRADAIEPFEDPCDRLTVLSLTLNKIEGSKVEGLKAPREIEGEERGGKSMGASLQEVRFNRVLTVIRGAHLELDGRRRPKYK